MVNAVRKDATKLTTPRDSTGTGSMQPIHPFAIQLYTHFTEYCSLIWTNSRTKRFDTELNDCLRKITGLVLSTT